ncbi:MAG: polymerase protein [Bacilli bacterium]|nr:polymerase protein [Bacilli bacterium]
MAELLQAEYPVKVTNLDKPLWPEAGITKAQLISYVIELAPLFLAHYRNRPLTVLRYPHGVGGTFFYQKNAPSDTPEWVTTFPVWSDERNGYLNYILIDSTATLIWLANQAALEWHPWFSTSLKPEYPNVLAFDLDPTTPDFEKVRKVTLVLHDVLEELRLPNAPKTSGGSGLAVYVPLQQVYTFTQTRVVMRFIAEEVKRRLPNDVTLERMVKHRGDKVYFDYVQHAQNKTLIGVYSARAHPLGLVSTPLTWQEVEAGARPTDFPLPKVVERVRERGDLFSTVLLPGVRLENALHQVELDSANAHAFK